jgi:putative heme iron utilization protein
LTRRPEADPLEAARQLWAGRFQGVISTHSLAESGYPFGSVTPFCLDRNGLPLFLFSHLAQHTRNLDASSRCAFTLSEAAAGDVQQTLRLTCLGDCSRVPPADQAAPERYFRYFPDARRYLEELNFRLYRLQPLRFYYNGGFATARWLGSERIVRASALTEVAERVLLEQVEREYGAYLQDRIPGTEAPGDTVQAVGIDTWGVDLRRGPTLFRLPFCQPLVSAAGLSDRLGNPTAPP